MDGAHPQNEWMTNCAEIPVNREVPTILQSPEVGKWLELSLRERRSICELGKNQSSETAPATRTESENRMSDEFKSILAVTEQRVYAEVNWQFVPVLEKHTFDSNILDQRIGMLAHRKHLKRLLEAQDLSPENHNFKSNGEKRKQGSVRCIAAMPKLNVEDDTERYIADIDIDLKNPNLGPFSVFVYLRDITGHLALSHERCFMC